MGLILSLAEKHTEIAHRADRTGNEIIALVPYLCFGQILQYPKALCICKKLLFEREKKTAAFSLCLEQIFIPGLVYCSLYSFDRHNYIPFLTFFLIIS